MSIFDLVEEDIMGLSDEMLAALLGRLIEAEAAANRIPLGAITHGGHDNAPDQGIDARVSWSGAPERTDFFPRRTTVFQSKAETMSRKPLTDEMAPGGRPRPIFQELAKDDGAYVMFCGRDDCNDRMLRDRKGAMGLAVSTVVNAGRLDLDFYDASRIVRWVNTHTGVAACCATGSGDRFGAGARMHHGHVPTQAKNSHTLATRPSVPPSRLMRKHLR